MALFSASRNDGPEAPDGRRNPLIPLRATITVFVFAIGTYAFNGAYIFEASP